MRSTRVILLLATCGSALLGADRSIAQSLSADDYPALHRCDSLNTQYDMGACISAEGDRADSLLNVEFSTFLSKMDSAITEADEEESVDTVTGNALRSARVQLLNSQKGWTEMRDADAEMTWIGLLGGTARGSMSGTEYIKDTYDRIRRLRQLRSIFLQ